MNRYGRRELTVFSHIQALLTLAVPNKVTELVAFNDKLVANVRALEAIDIKADSFGITKQSS